MGERNPTGVFVAAVIWLGIFACLAVAYRYWVHPRLQKKLQQDTGSASRYQHQVRLALDSFSGYALLRSAELQKNLDARGIQLVLDDDGADYPARMQALRDGKVDLAVFTIDSFIRAGADLGEFPASIVLILDETRGADAMVAYAQGVKNLQDLNDPAGRIVLTPQSPSEFLARVALANFNLPRLPAQWMQAENGAAEVFKSFCAADKTARRAYVLWEPYVSRALEEPGAHVLLDSSRLEGYIVDVLVAQREFLRDQPDLAAAVVEAYLRTAYARRGPADLEAVVLADARKAGDRAIGEKQARQIVGSIAWKNTLENYAHFGLLPAADARGLKHVEDMILQIADVLARTGALPKDPIAGQASALYYDRILRELKQQQFHPGRAINILAGGPEPAGAEAETIRVTRQLPALSPADWDALAMVGEMSVPPLSFARGAARLHVTSERHLDQLARQLSSFPHYYLEVRGHARTEGDPEANRELAAQRAAAAVAYLLSSGVYSNRLRATWNPAAGTGGDAQSVSFLLRQAAY